MNYLIIGAGAIGTYIGASLLDAGKKVSFLEREEFAAHLKQGGLHLKTPNREVHFTSAKVFSTMEAALQTKTNVVVFAMKSFDTPQAVEQLAPYKEMFDTVLCLQNGVENELLIAGKVGNDKVTGGSVTTAVSRLDAGSVVVSRERGIGIEDNGDTSQGIHADFMQAGLHPKLYGCREDMKWSKMLSNLMGNASCAILDMPPGQIYADPDLFHLEILQMKETMSVMKANGWKVVDLPSTPMGLLAHFISLSPEWLSQIVLLRPMAGGRGNKMPSFHIDLHSGRKDSEVEFLNGAVSRFGMKSGIPTPVNDTLVKTLLKLINHPEEIANYRQNKSMLLNDLREKGY